MDAVAPKIGVLAVARDEAVTLPAFFGLLDEIEQSPQVGSLSVVVVENDSIDGSQDILLAWASVQSNRRVKTFHFEEPRLKGRQLQRTCRLAFCRNEALAMLLEYDTDYVLVIDVDVLVLPSQVLALLSALSALPQAAMVCASALQNVSDVLGSGAGWSYYDSWALRDLQGYGGITGATNPFRSRRDRELFAARRPVSVASAFGGMAALPTWVIRQGDLRWDGWQGCEHWAFCEAARSLGEVFVIPWVRPMVIHPHPVPCWSAGYVEKVRQDMADLL
jgi:glycosyltransferase involved in cell wall biosynthesis